MYGPACNLSRGFSRHPLSGPKNNAGKPLGKTNLSAAKDLAAEILQLASGVHMPKLSERRPTKTTTKKSPAPAAHSATPCTFRLIAGSPQLRQGTGYPDFTFEFNFNYHSVC